MGRWPARERMRSGLCSNPQALMLPLGLALLACGEVSHTGGANGSGGGLGTGGAGTITTGGSAAAGADASSGGTGGQAGATPGSLRLCECTFEMGEPAARAPFVFEATLDGQPVQISSADALTFRFGTHVEAFAVQFSDGDKVHGHVEVTALDCNAWASLWSPAADGSQRYLNGTGWLRVSTTTADWSEGVSIGALQAEFSTTEGLAGPVLDARFLVPASLEDSWKP